MEPHCAGWTLYLPTYSEREWRGQCYGRGFHVEVDVVGENAISGTVASCQQGMTTTVTFLLICNFLYSIVY